MAYKQEGMREIALFAGAGGGILGGSLLGWRTVCAVEWDSYAAGILVERQNDGSLCEFPVWDDVQTFNGRPWRGRCDIISGGFPCTDISSAGRGAGIDGAASGMWGHMARIIGEVRPEFVFVENSPLLIQRGLARVLSQLAEMGYDATWGIIGAREAGAPHRRDRIWILAHTDKPGEPCERVEDSGSTVLEGREQHQEQRQPEGSDKSAGSDQDMAGRSDRQASKGEPERRPGPEAALPNADQQRLEGRSGDEHDRQESGRQHKEQDRHPPEEDLRGREGEGEVPDSDMLRCSPSGYEEERGGDRERYRKDAPSGSSEEVADSECVRQSGQGQHGNAVCAEESREGEADQSVYGSQLRPGWWDFEPILDGMANGVAPELDIHGAFTAGTVSRVAKGIPNRANRLKCIGNGQVPAAMALAVQLLRAHNSFQVD